MPYNDNFILLEDVDEKIHNSMLAIFLNPNYSHQNRSDQMFSLHFWFYGSTTDEGNGSWDKKRVKFCLML